VTTPDVSGDRYQVYVRKKIEKALSEIEQGEVLNQAEVETRMAELLKRLAP